MNTKLRMHTKCIYVNTYLGTKNGTWELPYLVWFTPFLCTDYADLISNEIQCKSSRDLKQLVIVFLSNKTLVVRVERIDQDLITHIEY